MITDNYIALTLLRQIKYKEFIYFFVYDGVSGLSQDSRIEQLTYI